MPVGHGCCLCHSQPAMCGQISLQESHIKQHFFLQRRSLHKHGVAAAIRGARRAAVSLQGGWNFRLCYVIGSGREALSLRDNNLEGCLEKHRRIQRVAVVLLLWGSSRFTCLLFLLCVTGSKTRLWLWGSPYGAVSSGVSAGSAAALHMCPKQ